MKKKKILIPIVILIILIASLYFLFFKEEKIEYSLAEVIRGSVLQEVSETGAVKAGEEINLSFKNGGQIEKIYVKEGDNIEPGQNLAKLDNGQLFIRLSEAKASLELAEAKKSDAQVSLENAERDLNNIKEKAQEDLDNAYEDALTVLDDAYLKIYNAFNTVHNIQKVYFSTPNEYGLKVIEEKARIKSAQEALESLLDNAKEDPGHDNIDSVLSQAKEALEKTGNAIKGVRDIADNAVYRDLVSSTEKTALDTQKLNINTVLTNAINSQQNISTVKINNITNINNAESQVITLKSQLKLSGDTVGLYRAQINQARAQVDLLEKEIQESIIQSPTKGKITKIKKREGEITQSTEVVVSLLPSSPFQVEADIYEEDIVKVEIGNKVDIILSAFPNKIFEGEVITIDPVEKLVEGIVYYEVTIDFMESPQGIKPGMTTDIIVKTASRENVLIIPEEAITKKDSKVTVQILSGDNPETREIKIGLVGSDGMVEVISGLESGEKVVIE